MHDELPRLGGRPREARAEHEGVEPHLELLDEILTRQSLAASGLFELDPQLCLADPVLGTQTLLLA
jgi:hypothetical protein